MSPLTNFAEICVDGATLMPADKRTELRPDTVSVEESAFIGHLVSPTTMKVLRSSFNPYPTAFPYGNGMVLHFYQQQESSTTKTVHKVINKGLKTYV